MGVSSRLAHDQDPATERQEITGAERIDLLQDTFLIGLPPTHRLAGKPGPIKLTDLADDDWIVPSSEGFLREACREAGFEPRVVAMSQGIATRGLIERGLGVG